MADKKYLIVYKGMASIPSMLRDFVKQAVIKEFEPFDVEVDFSGRKAARDLIVQFSDEVPSAALFGESSRMSINDELTNGDANVFVGLMKAMRLQTTGDNCEPAFPQTKESLGRLIANTAIHETAHMLGLEGHVDDKDNFMWESTIQHQTRVSKNFEYEVKRGDTLSSIVQRHKTSRLHACRSGPTLLTYFSVWQDPANKKEGFVGHSTKSGHRTRRANNPNWIYPGEKVALVDHSFRTQKYRSYYHGWLGKKKFSKEQITKMTKFIAQQIAAGKG
jgi:hypothetical protein